MLFRWFLISFLLSTPHKNKRHTPTYQRDAPVPMILFGCQCSISIMPSKHDSIQWISILISGHTNCRGDLNALVDTG